jgi:hypothetical protein
MNTSIRNICLVIIGIAAIGVVAHPFATERAVVAAQTEQDVDTKIVIGSGQPDDPCTVEIHASALKHLEEIGLREWQSACEQSVADQKLHATSVGLAGSHD